MPLAVRGYNHDVIAEGAGNSSLNVSPGPNLESNRLFVFAFAGVEWKPDEIPPAPVEQKPIVEKIVVPTPVSTEIKIQGEVKDAKTNNPAQATLQFVGNVTLNTVAGIKGDYSATFPNVGEYSIKIEAVGYIGVIEKINLQTSPKTGVNFTLVPIEKGVRVNLKSVLFQQSTPNLLQDSFKELDMVADFMKNNPAVRIELAGHTDNVGPKSLNLKLSNDRVIAVKKYLTNKGIDPKRIKGKGYGGTKPISPSDSEEARRLNRRVEFVITEN